MPRNQTAKPVTTTPVVVFRSENYTSLAIVRTLGRMGVKVYCIDHDPNALAMKSRYCAGRFLWDTDSSDPEATVQFLAEVARKIGQKAALLPTFDTRSLFVDQYRERLSQWFLLPQPDPGALARLYSKRLMYELCKSSGVPTPETVFPGTVEQAMIEGPSLRFPLVIKAIDGDQLMHRTGLRLAIAQRQSELFDLFSALSEPGAGNLALQEYIHADDQDRWLLGSYFNNSGECSFVLTGKKLRQFPIGGGVTTLGVCAPCESMVDSIRRIAKAAGYRGFIGADFVYDKRDGLWKLLDINPRPGANFRLFSDKNGLDAVRAMYLDLTGQSVPAVEPDWGRRWWLEDKDLHALRDHLLEGTLTLRAWLRSLRGVSEFAHLAIDDLRPSMIFATRVIAYYMQGVGRKLLPSAKHAS